MAIMSAALGYVQAAGPQQQPLGALPASVPPQRAFLDRYCVTCHNQRLKTAGLMLDVMDVTNVSDHTEVWEKVVRKLRAGVMPPAGRPRPDRASYDGLASWLETELDRAAAANPNPGRTESFHRLNRAEYQNAIRDLLSLDLENDVISLLPIDDGSYGFDNIANALRVSPTLIERYLLAAQKISRLAVGVPVPPTAEIFRVAGDLPQDDRIDGLPFGTRGGTLIRHTFPMDGQYVVRLRLARDYSNDVPRFTESHQLDVTLDGERVQQFMVAPPNGEAADEKRSAAGTFWAEDVDAGLQVRLPVKAGPREVGVAFVKKSPAQFEFFRQPFLRPQIRNLIETRIQPDLGSVTITGPFDPIGPGDTPSRRHIFLCRTASGSAERGCAKRILSTLARRAYRRPVTDPDIATLLTFYEDGLASGGFEVGIEMAVRRLLMSPEFLFRAERDPTNSTPNTAYRISDLELASRLSFFLWSSIPDDELLDLASRGRLKNPAVLEQQVRRMLADQRSRALVRNFAGQWLYLRNVPATMPDEFLFPDFDESLRQGFHRETELFFESLLHEDRSVLDLLTANYTFVNERLARHYGIPNVKGSHFRRVTLSDEARYGLLGQGSILTVTSLATRTSPVQRGKWILENLLGMPPPPPPPNVSDLKDNNSEGKVLSMRERMAQHRANPVCLTCHAVMDPLGFALEDFDATGRWRTRDESQKPIDAAGVLPDGTKFDGVIGLRNALRSHPEQFVKTMTEKLLTYALGRVVLHYDAPAVRTITREAARNDYRFSSVIIGIVNSLPFRQRRSES